MLPNEAPPPPPADQKLLVPDAMPINRARPINSGNAAHSERAIRRFSMAHGCGTFDVRCLHETDGGCTFNERDMTLDAICRVVPKLRHRNGNGSGVFIRPCLPFALADDVPIETVDRMIDDGYRIAAVIETSPGSHQVWIPLAGPLQTVERGICAAANEWIAELYGTDLGVAHRDSFGRAPGFRNNKPNHAQSGTTPLVTMVNRHCRFRGYDGTLLDEARRHSRRHHPQLLAERSVGGVHSVEASKIDPACTDDIGAFEVCQDDTPVVIFSAISTESLFDKWLTEMMRSGYRLPLRLNSGDVDRSQRDLDVLRSMHTAGVPHDTAQAALVAGSDKASDRGARYVDSIMRAVWSGQ